MARYSDTLLDRFGRPLAGALVVVSRSDDGSLAALTYDGGASEPNPLTAGDDGSFYFNTPGNYYDLSVRYGGRVVLEERQVAIGVTGLPAGSIVDALGAGTTVAASQRAVTEGIGSSGSSSTIATAKTVAFPSSIKSITTLGYSTPGKGGADYIYDASVDAAYVTANPRTSFLDAGGRGFKLIALFQVDLCAFGAAGDYNTGTQNGTDDAAALQAALNWASGNAAKISITHRHAIKTNVTTTNASVNLVGSLTPTTSELYFISNATLTVNLGTPVEYSSAAFRASGVGIRTVGVHTGAPVVISATGGSGATSVSLVVEDLDISGADINSGFRYGISLVNVRNSNFFGGRILGDRGHVPVQSVAGIHIEGDSDPVEVKFYGTLIYFVARAIDVSGALEGIYIDDAAFVACTYGVYAVSSSIKPLISIKNTHINTTAGGVYAQGFTQITITGCLFYAQSAVNYTGIQYNLDPGSPVEATSIFSDNVFIDTGTSGTSNAIVVGNGTGNESVLIDGNQFLGFDVDIVMQATTNGVRISAGNRGSGTGGKLLINDSSTAGNVIGGSVFASDSVSLTLDDGGIMQAGTVVLTLDASGNGSVTLPKPFPNTFISGTVCNGDAAVFGDSSFIVRQSACTLTAIAFAVRPNPGASSVRVNYTAAGG